MRRPAALWLHVTLHYNREYGEDRRGRRPQSGYGDNPDMFESSRTPLLAIVALAASASLHAAETLPDPTSADFCVTVQKLLTGTTIEGNNEVFDNMDDYRASKPSPNPLMIYQVVTYDEVGPIVVSCKVKTYDHLIAEYGEDAAVEQRYCPEIARITKAQAIAELTVENPEAAAVAEGFVIDEIEPFMMGSQYLADFQSSYVADDGTIHFQTPGLQTNWEDWIGIIMPDRLMGQTYCHLPTVDYMKRIALGTAEPGGTITTTDDAPTTPPGS